MAIRGIASVVDFFDKDTFLLNSQPPPLYSYQNHFPGTRVIGGISSNYNSFIATPLKNERDAGSMPQITLTFVATAANVDLVEEAIANQYLVLISIYRWNVNEGIDDPSSFNPFAFYLAVATGGSLDTSTVSLEVNHYNSTTNADMPWRKIPWTIVGPLSPRR
jgi:hypothetical protein